MKKTVLAVVGPISAGKGTVIDILKKMGFESSSTSDRIREEIRRRGMEITRDSLTTVGNDLRTQFGNEILAKKTAEYLDASSSNYFVIDSIRNPDEIRFFREKYGMRVLAITADQNIRYRRFLDRKVNSEPMSLQEFQELDNGELRGENGQHAQRVDDCMREADVTLTNNSTFEDLEEQISSALKKLQITP